VLPDAFGPDNLGEHIGRHASDGGGAAGDSSAGGGGDDVAGDDGTADSLGEHDHPKH
ncbi:cytidine deaminase, partial [Burkholderia multivorans]